MTSGFGVSWERSRVSVWVVGFQRLRELGDVFLLDKSCMMHDVLDSPVWGLNKKRWRVLGYAGCRRVASRRVNARGTRPGIERALP